MRKRLALFLVCALPVAAAACLLLVSTVHGQQPQKEYVNRQTPMEHMSGLLRLVETIPLPTEGYMDHFTYDLKRGHVFLCGENNKSLVVVDIKAGKVIHETTGLGGNPRKPFYVPETDEIWSDLGDNTVVAFNGTTFEVTKVVPLTGGIGAAHRTPDNARFDAARGLYYAFIDARDNQGSVDIVDIKAAKLVGSIPVNGNDPAGGALSADGSRLYVGMGDSPNGVSVVKVIDTAKREVIAEWPITGGAQPHVGAIDNAHHRLFMGSRMGGGHSVDPGKFVVLDTDTGKVVQALDATAGADEIFYDQTNGRIYFEGTTGTIVVFHEDDADHFRVMGRVPTGPIAKSGLWIPELKRYYVAVPKVLSELMPVTQYGVDNWITEEAHLMVFEEIP
jgi:DNA-binding beta-propeller fold protein YncE